MIKYFGLPWLDPIGSVITSIIIIAGGVKITKESLNILMEGTPKGYSVEEIQNVIKEINSDLEVLDIKVWCINEIEVYALIDLKFDIDNEVFRKNIQSDIEKKVNIPKSNIYINFY